MKVYTLKRRQFFPISLKTVFSFFERPENLSRITPPDLGFKILTPSPIPMKSGTLIDYAIRVHGFPMRWTSMISAYDPPHRFVDVQLKGPYAFWHHSHRFEEADGGTWVEDEVRYALPFGVFGRLAHVLFVKRQLNKIFDHRAKVIDDVFFGENKAGGSSMNIVVAGGTGFVGASLVKRLIEKNHQVVLLTRNPGSVTPVEGLKAVEWDGENLGDWTKHVDGADAVINLAGDPIAEGRWTQSKKEKIKLSRINSTRAIIDAIKNVSNRPSTLINASAVGYYGNVEEGDVDETAQKGTGFLPDVCASWEEEAKAVESMGVRLVLLRIGIVLEQGGGALSKMVTPFKLFAGGHLGSGRQWFPWVHRDDVIGIVEFALSNADVSGPVNVASPAPVTMKSFCKTLGKVLHRPSWAPVPSFVLKAGLGEMSDMLLEGQKVLPVKVVNAGYTFKHGDLEGALKNIFKAN